MKVLVTGATGFLGRHVVDALLHRGHAVRALARPAADVERLDWADRVEVARGDLRGPEGALAEALAGVEVVVHLAAGVTGDDDARFVATAVGTERLLGAMKGSQVRRLVLAGSFAVYDWRRVRGTLTEEAPVEAAPGLYERDGYAVAKVWQERLARRAAAEQGWELTVLRPGAIWGAGNPYPPNLGHRMGRWHLVIGPMSVPRLTYVENCAEAFAAAVDSERAAGETINLVDGHPVSAWRYTGEYLRRTGGGGWRVPVPYGAGMAAARLARAVSRLLFGPGGKLPSILVPCRFEARFKPVRYPNEGARRVLGWSPRYEFEECLERAFADAGTGPAESAKARGAVPGGAAGRRIGFTEAGTGDSGGGRAAACQEGTLPR